MKLPRTHQVCFIAPFLSLALSFALLGTSANAAVTLTDSLFTLSGNTGLVDEGSGVYSYTFNSTALAGFSASGTDKLVVGVMNKDHTSVAGPLVSSVTYNSEGLTQAVQVALLRVRNSIFYLDNVGSDGDLKITFSDGTTSNQTGYIIGLYALNGTATGVAHTASQSGTGASVNVSTSSGFVLDLWSRNNGSLELIVPSDFTEDIDEVVSVTGGALVGVFASSITTSAGSYLASVSGTDGNTGMVGAAFDAAAVIPEPSSTLLIGLSSLTLLIRRRR
jgi:hypothetical protein